MFSLLLVEKLVLQYRLSLFDDVYLFDDSLIILHKTRRILTNCTYEYLLAAATAKGTFVNSSPSPVKFWFGTDSTEWRGVDNR